MENVVRFPVQKGNSELGKEAVKVLKEYIDYMNERHIETKLDLKYKALLYVQKFVFKHYSDGLDSIEVWQGEKEANEMGKRAINILKEYEKHFTSIDEKMMAFHKIRANIQTKDFLTDYFSQELS